MKSENRTPSKRIVICDDNDDILDMLGAFLRSSGYDVALAHNHSELMPLLRNNPPDLLILDIRMPELDGFDIVEMMQEEHLEIPVFIATAHDHFMYRKYAPVAGVREYFAKPFDYNELLEKIKALDDKPAKVNAAAEIS